MSEKRFTLTCFNKEKKIWRITDKKGLSIITLGGVEDRLNELNDENRELRNLIKANVFREYREGSLADLQFKAIAYDDIVNVEMDYDAEPKLIIYCKKGTKSDIERYARVKTFNLFIPFGVDYIIKEVI